MKDSAHRNPVPHLRKKPGKFSGVLQHPIGQASVRQGIEQEFLQATRQT